MLQRKNELQTARGYGPTDIEHPAVRILARVDEMREYYMVHMHRSQLTDPRREAGLKRMWL